MHSPSKQRALLGFKNIFSLKDLLRIGIKPSTNNEFFDLLNDKIYLGSKRSLMLKGKIEMYEFLRNKIRMTINVNGVKFEKEVDKDFSLTTSEIVLGTYPDELLPLE